MTITLNSKQFQDLEVLVETLREQFSKHRYEGKIVTEKSGTVEWNYKQIDFHLLENIK